MNRPFAGASLAFAAGIAVGFMGPFYFVAIPAAIPIASALVVMALTLNRWWRAAALILLVLGGAARYQAWSVRSVPLHLLEAIASKPGLHPVRGIISSDPSPSPFSDFYDKKIAYRSVFVLDVKEIRRGKRWVRTSGKARVSLKTRGRIDLEYGDYIQLEGSSTGRLLRGTRASSIIGHIWRGGEYTSAVLSGEKNW